jgi:hypothetical protein
MTKSAREREIEIRHLQDVFYRMPADQRDPEEAAWLAAEVQKIGAEAKAERRAASAQVAEDFETKSPEQRKREREAFIRKTEDDTAARQAKIDFDLGAAALRTRALLGQG